MPRSLLVFLVLVPGCASDLCVPGSGGSDEEDPSPGNRAWSWTAASQVDECSGRSDVAPVLAARPSPFGFFEARAGLSSHLGPSPGSDEFVTPVSWQPEMGFETAAPVGTDPFGRLSMRRFAGFKTPSSIQDPPGGQRASSDDEVAAAAKALSDPASDIWAMFTEFNMSFSDGDAVTGSDSKIGFEMIFQPIMPIPLTEDLNLITRPTIPIPINQAIPDGTGGVDRKGVGLGDAKLPLIPVSKKGFDIGGGNLVFGVGPTFGFPTGTSSAYSSKTWEAGPSGVVVYRSPKVTAGVFPQYWWSYADRSGSQPSTSHGSLLYFFWYNLPDAWQVGTAPTITHNHRADSDDAWNVPIGLLVAKTVKLWERPVKLQFAIEYSVVSEDTYGKEVLFRFNVIPVIKSLFQEPLFD